MSCLAIDPGPDKSAYLLWGAPVMESGHIDNEELMVELEHNERFHADIIACEMIACYGMPVGKETFETCVWIGRFMERAPRPIRRVYRKDVKMHLCGSMKAKDGNIRQALIDKYGKPGTKKQPGPTYGITSHLWSCLAIADYAICNHGDGSATPPHQKS